MVVIQRRELIKKIENDSLFRTFTKNVSQAAH